MAKPDPWPLIHTERRVLLADLQDLLAEKWETPSLCPGWTVRQVLGHMTATARTTPGGFFVKFAGSGFRFNAMSEKNLAEQTQGTPADLLARFKEVLDATSHPPGPVDAMIGENVVHPEDIRRPLGINHAYPAEMTTWAADFYKKSNLLIGGKRRAAGVTFRATDTDWTSGSGPEVAGPIVSIVLAITGRKVALADLTGDGVAVLQARA